MVFRMFMAFLIFDPSWPFCKNYCLCVGFSLCKMNDFQNCLISRIFGVFSRGFFSQTNSKSLLEWFFKCFWHGNHCTGYSLCKLVDFQNCLISRIFGVFLSGLLHSTVLTFLGNPSLRVFCIFNFWPKLTIFQRLCLCMGYILCKMADFQNCLISRIFSVFLSNLFQWTALAFLENRFLHLFGIFNRGRNLNILQSL